MSAEHVQTKREIENVLSLAGLRPQKRLGQNFLIDGNLMRMLAAGAEIDPHDFILEVGAGTGGLTDLIIRNAGRVLCVELDRGLFDILRERFEGRDGVSIIHGDILEQKHRIRGDVGEAIKGHTAGDSGTAKLVSNLPYQVATPLLMNLLVGFPEVSRYCFTVQAEVGERIMAPANCRAYGPLSITTQLLCRLRIIARIPPQAFWPRPTVESIMIRADVTEPPFSDCGELPRFVALVRGCFDHRRKTLRTAIGYVVNEAQRDRVCSQFDPRRRPETLTIEEWVQLFRIVEEH